MMMMMMTISLQNAWHWLHRFMYVRVLHVADAKAVVRTRAVVLGEQHHIVADVFAQTLTVQMQV